MMVAALYRSGSLICGPMIRTFDLYLSQAAHKMDYMARQSFVSQMLLPD